MITTKRIQRWTQDTDWRAKNVRHTKPTVLRFFDTVLGIKSTAVIVLKYGREAPLARLWTLHYTTSGMYCVLKVYHS